MPWQQQRECKKQQEVWQSAHVAMHTISLKFTALVNHSRDSLMGLKDLTPETLALWMSFVPAALAMGSKAMLCMNGVLITPCLTQRMCLTPPAEWCTDGTNVHSFPCCAMTKHDALRRPQSFNTVMTILHAEASFTLAQKGAIQRIFGETSVPQRTHEEWWPQLSLSQLFQISMKMRGPNGSNNADNFYPQARAPHLCAALLVWLLQLKNANHQWVPVQMQQMMTKKDAIAVSSHLALHKHWWCSQWKMHPMMLWLWWAALHDQVHPIHFIHRNSVISRTSHLTITGTPKQHARTVEDNAIEDSIRHRTLEKFISQYV